MRQIRVEIRERHRLMILMALGLIGSVFFLGRAGDELRQAVKESGGHVVRQLAQWGQEDGSRGMWRGLFVRVLLPVGWISLSFTAWGSWALYLSWIYLGFSVGTLLWTLVASCGWRGPFYFWSLVFPQYLCYLPALLLLYMGCLRWYQFRRERRRYPPMAVLTPQTRMFLLRIILGGLLYGLGVWMELQINPWILKKTL